LGGPFSLKVLAMAAQPLPLRIPVQNLADFAAAAFEKVGLRQRDAQAVGALMAEAELQGSEGHGMMRLPHYTRRIRAGGVNTQPNIRIVEERAAMALVDGDNGMGHLVVKRAAEIAIAKARTAGSAWVGTRMSNHAGPASLYARMPLAEGMIGMYFAVGSANHLPPWGGLDMLLSTNPIAVAIPTQDEPPVVLDMATTIASMGKVKTKMQRGEPLPEGWMVDRAGKPLTDSKRGLEGLLLPIGGYKGYGLSLVFGLLAGTLNDAAMGKDVVDFNADDVTTTNTGQAILAIDPAAFGDPGEFRRRVDAVVRDMRASQRMPGVERIWLPGEQSHEKRVANARDGVPIVPALAASLDRLATDLGIEKLKGAR
jgi:LDH2 family malate/lactate/ureidoglycolate dehydrogenase